MAGALADRRKGQMWGVRAAAAVHVAGNMARHSRTLKATSVAVQTTFRSLRRVAGLLWLEITGLFFVLFAVVGASAAWREYHHQGVISRKLIAAVCFSFVFGWFGLTSFWRTKRK